MDFVETKNSPPPMNLEQYNDFVTNSFENLEPNDADKKKKAAKEGKKVAVEMPSTKGVKALKGQLTPEQKKLVNKENLKPEEKALIAQNPALLKRRQVTQEAMKKKGLIKKIGGAILTGGVSAAIQDRKKIAAIGKKVIVATTVGPMILPFIPVMRAAIKKKGLNPPNDIEGLARMFFKEVLQKKKSADKTKSNFEFMYEEENSVAPIAAIIPPIISFIGKLVKKKESGEKLSPEEKLIADGGDAVKKKLKKEGKKGGKLTPKEEAEIIAESTSDGNNSILPDTATSEGDAPVSSGGMYNPFADMSPVTMGIIGLVVAVLIYLIFIRK